MASSEPDLITPVAEAPVPRPVRRVRWLVGGLLALAFAVALMGPAGPVVWATIRANLDAWQAGATHNPLAAVLLFFAAYAALASLPIPVLTAMSLLAGCLFGRSLGTAVASAAYTVGVTAAFLAARGLFREPLLRRFGNRLGALERGLRRDGAFYLLAMRLMPAVPFFLVNWLMALTPIPARTFALVSWVGVLPLTFLLTSVGAELGAIETPADVLSPGLILSLAALGLAPIVIRLALRRRFRVKEGA
jgi:uncharacterized membrane protein YdjX (TVP38/TMEM64 family)